MATKAKHYETAEQAREAIAAAKEKSASKKKPSSSRTKPSAEQKSNEQQEQVSPPSQKERSTIEAIMEDSLAGRGFDEAKLENSSKSIKERLEQTADDIEETVKKEVEEFGNSSAGKKLTEASGRAKELASSGIATVATFGKQFGKQFKKTFFKKSS